MKTPAYYRAPLKSRAQITAWLIAKARENPRPSYGMFCFDVKLGRLDLSFNHLAALACESGELPRDASPRYLAACEALLNKETLCEMAEESARESVTDDDTNRILWNGDKVLASWSFAGRSGGWLVLEEFDGVTLAGRGYERPYSGDPDSFADYFAEWPFARLRNLYRFLIQCAHDFRHPEREVEYQAAFHLFANVCADVPTDADMAARIAAESAEAAERAHWEARDTVTL